MDAASLTPATPTIIFLHIPKAAGTTLHTILERLYEPAAIFSGSAPAQMVEGLQRLSAAAKARLKVVKGHCAFGLHEHLPQPATYITLLRDPVERVISNYYYVLRSPAHRLHGRVQAERMSLADYVRSGINAQLDNGQVRLLSGWGMEVKFGACSPAVLESAKRHLDQHFAVAGLVERFDESLLLLQRAFGWPPPFYVLQNATKKRAAQASLAPEAVEQIARLNRLDYELCQYASRRLEAAIQRESGAFQTELADFRKANALYAAQVKQQTPEPSAEGSRARRWFDRLRHRRR